MNKLNKDLLKSNIEKIAHYDFDNHKVFGCAYCVIQENDVIYKRYFGNTSADNTEPVTKNTMFRLASMTKPITAIAALILVERGQLSLSDKVSDYLPEYKDVHITQISDTNEIIDLGKSQAMTDEDKKSLDNTVNFHAKAGLDFEPGTKQAYFTGRNL